MTYSLCNNLAASTTTSDGLHQVKPHLSVCHNGNQRLCLCRKLRLFYCMTYESCEQREKVLLTLSCPPLPPLHTRVMVADPRFQQFYGADDGSVLTYVTQTRIVKASSGESLGEEEEVLVGDSSKKVSPPRTVIELANVMFRWGNTIILANFGLQKPMFGPMYMLVYVDMLCCLTIYPHMTCTQYASYVNENRLRLIVDVNECGADLDSALIRARRFLWEEDLPGFRKLVPPMQLTSTTAGSTKGKAAGSVVISTSSVTTQAVSVKCEQKLKLLSEKNAALAKRNTEIRDLKLCLVKKGGDGGGYSGRQMKRPEGEVAGAAPNVPVTQNHVHQ